MAEHMKIKKLPLTSLVIGRGQVRAKESGKDMDSLVASIQKVGLLKPIIVAATDDPKKFKIIAGQRRFLAHKMIKSPTIRAAILSRKSERRRHGPAI